MSTRCITTVRSRWGNNPEWKTHANIYRHHDGYLEGGHGEWLYEFLRDLKVVNGLSGNEPPRFANGPGRLAAMMVAELYRDDHGPDLVPDSGPRGQEYHYQVDIVFGFDGGTITVTVFDGPMTFFGGGGEECTNQIFSGTVAEYGEFLKQVTESV